MHIVETKGAYRMTLPTFTTPTERLVDRDTFLKIIRTALPMGHSRFAREACLAWLAIYPGDLLVSLIYAQILLRENHPKQTLTLLQRLCQLDPEYLDAFITKLDCETRIHAKEAYRIKGHQQPAPRIDNAQLFPYATYEHIYALGGNLKSVPVVTKTPSLKPNDHVAGWSYQVRQARKALEQDKAPGQDQVITLAQAEESLTVALAGGITTPLVAVTHLRLLMAKKVPPQSLRKLAEFYSKRWPECLQFRILLANMMMGSGEADKAVLLLHKAAAEDITGQVVTRLWGDHHPYLALWPDRLEIKLELAIPAPIAASLGWNQLPFHSSDLKPGEYLRSPGMGYAKTASTPLPETSYPSSKTRSPKVAYAVPETLRQVQEELEKAAARLNQRGLSSTDGRFPVYVVLTTQRGLETQYGGSSRSALDKEMRHLVASVQSRRDWNALLYYADLASYPGIEPAKHNDPWSVKLALADLDASLALQGEMIGAVLIVGGPDVVPFHNLPNPVDDADDDVPSDNPYGTRDENYFIPEWPVGRLPGGSSSDPSTLLYSLRVLTERHTLAARDEKPVSWLSRLRMQITSWFQRLPLIPNPSGMKRLGFGYTAAVWRKASAVVFKPIGEPKELKVSPPISIANPAPAPLPPARLGYFNLHGLVDAVEWFGQSDPTSGGELDGDTGWAIGNTPDYPIALRPQDIQNSGRAPEVVFSEACYGSHILGKSVEEAMALKFLQSGSQAVVGSTCTAYGSIAAPLIAADFLGHAFWSFLRQGCPAGEALRRAKINLAREMHQRQGYLDGEDQKTLISFILFGDPLAMPVVPHYQAKSVLRSLKPPAWVNTVCDRQRDEDVSQPVPAGVITYAKQIVNQYLPGMEDAEITLSQEHLECLRSGHSCPTGQFGAKAGSSTEKPKRRVVVLSKQITRNSHLHRHYARITLDEQNRMVKLVVSR